MSFNIALSGINASQKDLDTTANNIANVNTFGLKEPWENCWVTALVVTPCPTVVLELVNTLCE